MGFWFPLAIKFNPDNMFRSLNRTLKMDHTGGSAYNRQRLCNLSCCFSCYWHVWVTAEWFPNQKNMDQESHSVAQNGVKEVHGHRIYIYIYPFWTSTEGMNDPQKVRTKTPEIFKLLGRNSLRQNALEGLLPSGGEWMSSLNRKKGGQGSRL